MIKILDYDRINFNLIHRFWIFDGKKLRTGPLPITRYGLNKDMNNLDAVLSWRGTTKQYFFKGDRFWRFDYMTRRVDPGYPKSMKSWKGIPSNIDSVFQWRNKAIYFFKGTFIQFDNLILDTQCDLTLIHKAWSNTGI